MGLVATMMGSLIISIILIVLYGMLALFYPFWLVNIPVIGLVLIFPLYGSFIINERFGKFNKEEAVTKIMSQPLFTDRGCSKVSFSVLSQFYVKM